MGHDGSNADNMQETDEIITAHARDVHTTDPLNNGMWMKIHKAEK